MKKHPHTCGEDPASVSSTASCRDPPHACGEDTRSAIPPQMMEETPPRMWGRPISISISSSLIRNTPTHVGKTLTGTFTRTNTEKHPHACREDQQGFCQYALRQETPPHMWGRPRHLQISGIQQRKHPHACGEDNIFERAKTASGETPPRMWGRLIDPASINQLHRNTPTHVGKTSGGRLSSLRTSETPPRMWGRRISSSSASGLSRNTPTHVGKTPAYCV